MTRKEKIKNMFMNVLIGDALGCTTEFKRKRELNNNKKHECVIGGGAFNIKAGCGTDDTDMTMCIVRAVNRVGLSAELEGEIKKEFVKWLESDPADIGNACRLSIKEIMEQGYAEYDKHRRGNGSLMRALPLAVCKGNNEELSIMQSRLTHNNEKVDSIIKLYVKYVNDILDDKETENFEDKIDNINLEEDEASGLAEIVFYQAVKINKLNMSDEEKMIKAVNMGGDTDTLGAILGSMLITELRKDWINCVELAQKENLEEIDKFIENYC